MCRRSEKKTSLAKITELVTIEKLFRSLLSLSRPAMQGHTYHTSPSKFKSKRGKLSKTPIFGKKKIVGTLIRMSVNKMGM